MVRLLSITYLATWRFCEPQSPFVHERMFNVEIDGVMEDSNLFILVLSLCAVWGGVLVVHSLFRLGSIFRRHITRKGGSVVDWRRADDSVDIRALYRSAMDGC